MVCRKTGTYTRHTACIKHDTMLFSRLHSYFLLVASLLASGTGCGTGVRKASTSRANGGNATTLLPAVPQLVFTALTFSAEQVVAVGHRGDCPVTLASHDGLSWVREDRPCGEGTLESVAYGDQGFFAVGGIFSLTRDGNADEKPLLLQSQTGREWTKVTHNIPGKLTRACP
jgi:hypothetical protein